MRPQPLQTIADPACGTGGFLLAAYDYLTSSYRLDKNQTRFLKEKTFSGNEIVANTRRLCLMNMFLHQIGTIDGSEYYSHSIDKDIIRNSKVHRIFCTAILYCKDSSALIPNCCSKIK